MVFLFKILVYMLMIPLYITLYIFYFGFLFMFYIFKFAFSIFETLINIIVSIFVPKRIRRVNTTKYYQPKSNNPKRKIIYLRENEYDEKFENDAKLWSLSETDKRIAKQERMSPADFIEAEERDDDELVTDEWEDE